MSGKTGKSEEACRELVRVLEEAIHVGADSVGLEHDHGDLLVYYYCGNMGLGAPRIPEDMETEVLDELARRAGLARRVKGKMQLTLLGKEYEVLVKSYQDFDEWCYRLTLKERKTKPGGGIIQ